MPNINMDLNRYPGPVDGPQLEFTLPQNELQEVFVVGSTGWILIPAEVTQVNRDYVSFRKRGKARVNGQFSEVTVEQLENELPHAER